MQIVGIVAVAAFVLGSGWVMFNALKATIGLRVPVQAEITGLDIFEHGLVSYPEFTNAFSVPSEPKPGSPHALAEGEPLAARSSPAAGD